MKPSFQIGSIDGPLAGDDSSSRLGWRPRKLAVRISSQTRSPDDQLGTYLAYTEMPFQLGVGGREPVSELGVSALTQAPSGLPRPGSRLGAVQRRASFDGDQFMGGNWSSLKERGRV